MITTCFQRGTVIRKLESTEKYSAIHELVRKAPVFSQIEDLGSFEQAVINREKLQSTGLGHGVAVSHGKTYDVNSLVIALGISKHGIDFGAIDGRPVHLLFVIANHPDHQSEYLEGLSALVKMVRSPDFRSDLLTCIHTTEVENKLCNAFSSLIGSFQNSAETSIRI